VELVVRAAIVFAFLWMVTRVVGAAALTEITTFELLIYVTMGDLIQQAVTQQDFSLTSAFLAIGVFALLTIALSYSSWRWPRLRPLIRGTPVLVMHDGVPMTAVLRRQRLSVEDLRTEAREQGIRRLSAIELAILETDGKISFFQYESDDGESGAADKPEAS
jgi:uncharacterized membrane protein YcaP (DUF421 family)